MPPGPDEHDFWPDTYCNESDISCPEFKHPTKGIPVEKMWGGTFCPPPKGGTHSVFGTFLSLGRSVWADSFCNESDISCLKFRHPTKGIRDEKKVGAFSAPPKKILVKIFLLKFSPDLGALIILNIRT